MEDDDNNNDDNDDETDDNYDNKKDNDDRDIRDFNINNASRKGTARRRFKCGKVRGRREKSLANEGTC